MKEKPSSNLSVAIDNWSQFGAKKCLRVFHEMGTFDVEQPG
ncbi:hypothetical protein VP01_5605g1 [Puccinia sorghi]|uniref:Uncharacterized protein n=1 Tax=Puccinia sorghi TaxID=27349 RepID=A0A0L6UJS0_9BASI|nr:hypothetical protein VP01_5605g1 [Puccinia sorghi]